MLSCYLTIDPKKSCLANNYSTNAAQFQCVCIPLPIDPHISTQSCTSPTSLSYTLHFANFFFSLFCTHFQIATSVSETMEFQKIWLWQQYAARVTPGVQRIVEFAKRVPGFCDFTQDDQLILIKLGFFEVWLSHVARMINDATLTFDDGTYLTRQQLEILYDVSNGTNSDFYLTLSSPFFLRIFKEVWNFF